MFPACTLFNLLANFYDLSANSSSCKTGLSAIYHELQNTQAGAKKMRDETKEAAGNRDAYNAAKSMNVIKERHYTTCAT